MTRGREIAVRLAITVGVVGLFVAVLAATGYPWSFGDVWKNRHFYVKGLGNTAVAAVAGYAIGLVLGVFVALARISRRLAIRHLGDLYVQFIRGMPFVLLLLISVYALQPLLRVNATFTTGTVTLGAFAGAYVGEIFRAGIESIERGQFEAARSLGLTRGQTLRHVVFPQAVKRMIPPLTSEFIAITKESSLLYVVGVLELTYAANEVSAKTTLALEAYLVTGAFYLAITIPLSILARRLEGRLGESERSGLQL